MLKSRDKWRYQHNVVLVAMFHRHRTPPFCGHPTKRAGMNGLQFAQERNIYPQNCNFLGKCL